jgi:hypothetical protein
MVADGGGEEQRQPAQRIDPRRWRGASEEISQSICYTAEEVAPAGRPVGIECGRELRSCGKVLKIHLAVFLFDAEMVPPRTKDSLYLSENRQRVLNSLVLREYDSWKVNWRNPKIEA